MRTVSMRVVIVPPRFEGLPTASSQTVPLDDAYLHCLTSGEERNDRPPFPDSPTVGAGFEGCWEGHPRSGSEANHGANSRSKDVSQEPATTPHAETRFRIAPGSLGPCRGSLTLLEMAAIKGDGDLERSGSWSQTGRGIGSKRSRTP